MKDEQKIPEPFNQSLSETSNDQSLSETERNYKYYLQNSSIPFCVCDTQGIIQFYNNAAVELWGSTPQTGKDLWCGSWKMLHPNGQTLSADEWPVAIALKEQKKMPGTELILERPDGEKRTVVSFSDPIFDETGNITGVTNTLIDTTLQKQNTSIKTTPSLNSDDRYHKMIDEVEDYAILMLDKHGTIINWNKGVQKIKGYAANEIIGKNFSVFYRESDRESGLPERLLNEAKENGRALHEGWRMRKDGTNFWGSVAITALHNDENEVIGYTKVTRDLTERMNAEEYLRSQKEFVELILNSSIDLIAVFDTDLRYVSLNKQAIDTYQRDDLIGKKITDVFPEAIESGMHDDLLKALEGSTIRNTSYQSKVLNRYFENYYIPLKNDRQEVYGVLAIGHDNSVVLEAAEKVKLANAELEKKNKELERSNDSLEQFAYVSSHDLQEPLRKIQTFSDLILTRINDPGFNPNEYLDKINASANRMSLLINDLLNFSRLNKADELYEKVDLEKVLDQVITDFELLITQKKAVIKRTALPVIDAIPIQMNQLFYNMLSNALKFSDTDPEIDITAQTLTPEAIKDHPQLETGKNYLHLNFTDNGIGFDQMYALQIFTIFQRLNNYQKYSGTGIGLAICKKIVDNHGGHISAKSEPGKGTSFDIYLPV